MATNSTPAAKTTKAPKVQKPFVDRISEMVKKQVISEKITVEEMATLRKNIDKYAAFLE